MYPFLILYFFFLKTFQDIFFVYKIVNISIIYNIVSFINYNAVTLFSKQEGQDIFSVFHILCQKL